jgi:patatin-related protein
MREKELRLALVLTGGVSLVVYMHGVSKEILKLVRASKVYHTGSAGTGQGHTYSDLNDDPGRETDTEEIYFELLKQIAPAVDLRIVVDVIAGASAGGVNGILLGRALAHDLPMDAHRAMWLDHADVLELMEPETVARPWSKLYMDVIVRIIFRRQLRAISADRETRRKLRQFARSRWFRPPFSGRRYCGWLFDALNDMAKGKDRKASLLPDGHELEVLVTITDFDGHERRIQLHDPQEITEPEHRHIVRYNYLRQSNGDVVSDFNSDAVAGLVFGARATSSFPGAFPPASLGEIEEVLKQRGETWTSRNRFVAEKLGPVVADGQDPLNAVFLDGCIVMGKPFAAAISAVSAKPAHRDVIRRIVFIDPDPGVREPGERIRMPGMLRTLLASLIEIPSHDPVGDDLARADEVNRRIRLLRHVVNLARPNIGNLVDGIVVTSESDPPTSAKFEAWRHEANEAAARESGIAYDSYFRIKILSVLNHVEKLIQATARQTGVTLNTQLLRSTLSAWIERQGTVMRPSESQDSPAGFDRSVEILILRSLDVDFRIRRMRFTIRRLNELYRLELDDNPPESEQLDTIKAALFAIQEQTMSCWDPRFYGADLAAAVSALAETMHDNEQDLDARLQSVLESLGQSMGLVAIDRQIDEVFSVMVLNYLQPRARHELVVAYVGFSFFDLLTFPLLQSYDYDELEEILIDRISPDDANALRPEGASELLRGTGFRHFNAFLSRAYRENDYLWGRLNAADRLVDIVSNALQGIVPDGQLDTENIKCRLFQKILDAEAPFLGTCQALIGDLHAEISARSSG